MSGINLYISDSVLCTYMEPRHKYATEKIVEHGRAKYFSKDLLVGLAKIFDVILLDTAYGYTHQPQDVMPMDLFDGIIQVASYHTPTWLEDDLKVSQAYAYAVVLPYIPPSLVQFLQDDKVERFNVGISTYNDEAADRAVQVFGTALTDEDIEYLTRFVSNAKEKPAVRIPGVYEYLAGGYS